MLFDNLKESCGYPETKVSFSRVAIAVTGSIALLIMLFIAIYKFNRSYPFMKGSNITVQGPPKLVVLRMDMAIYTYEDIMSITKNLSETYIIGYGASSTI